MPNTFEDLHPQLIGGLTDLPETKIPKPIYPTAVRQASTGSTEMHQSNKVYFEDFYDLFEDFAAPSKRGN
jgi:hypothetical protein